MEKRRGIILGLFATLLIGTLALGAVVQQLAQDTWYSAFMKRASTYDPGTWYHVEMFYPPGPNGEHAFALWQWSQMIPPGGEIILKQLSIHPEDNRMDTNTQCENIIFNYGWETAATAEFCDTRFGVVQVAGLPISIDPEKAPVYWLQDEAHVNGVIIIRHDNYIDRAKYANGAVPIAVHPRFPGDTERDGAWWITNLLSDSPFLDCYQDNVAETVVAKVDLGTVLTVKRLALRYWIGAIGTPTIKMQYSSDDLTWTTFFARTGTGEKSGGFMWGAPYHNSEDNKTLRYVRITQQGQGQVCPMKLFAWVAN